MNVVANAFGNAHQRKFRFGFLDMKAYGKSISEGLRPLNHKLISGVYILESLLISPPPAFDFLPRDASRRVFISMVFFPI